MDALAHASNGAGATASTVPESFTARAMRLLGEADAGNLDGLEDDLARGRQSVLSAVQACFQEQRISECAFHRILSKLLATWTHAAIRTEDVDPEFVRRIPIRYVRRFRILGLRPADGYMPLVTDNPVDPTVADYVSLLLRIPARLEFAPTSVLHRAINDAYSGQESDFSDVLGTIVVPDGADDVTLTEDGDLLDTASRAPVIKLVNMLLFEAVKRGASDVHVQPLESRVQVRFRIDGVLYDYLEIPVHLLDEVVSRIKVVGRMDIAEKRLAQDGRTTVTVGDRLIDLRISIIPTCYGERAVLRLLDKSARLYTLPELGMSDADRERFERLIQRTHGIILVTGPTGSGKSTTLYAALQYLDRKERNIITLEDPIEYQLPGISQTQVSTKKGMTFATGLRAVLRQDPDIIMVGEIRDEETARMAVQSSLTGHLVFSTLHTNNAAGAVSRLLDLGIESYLVASSLVACAAQRLIRMVCSRCSESGELDRDALRRLQLNPTLLGAPIRHARGCDQCAGTGYRGRRGIFEILAIDDRVRELVVAKAKAGEIEPAGIAGGMATLRQDAVRKLLEGQTTVDEVLRITHEHGVAMDADLQSDALLEPTPPDS